MAEFKELLGKTLTSIAVSERGTGEDKIEFHADDGSVYRMYHSQYCCEHVFIEDIVGDIQALVGDPILLAEEATSDVQEQEGGYGDEMWTFYKLATVNSFANIRWNGSSNGDYSISVDFTCILNPTPTPENSTTTKVMLITTAMEKLRNSIMYYRDWWNVPFVIVMPKDKRSVVVVNTENGANAVAFAEWGAKDVPNGYCIIDTVSTTPEEDSSLVARPLAALQTCLNEILVSNGSIYFAKEKANDS